MGAGLKPRVNPLAPSLSSSAEGKRAARVMGYKNDCLESLNTTDASDRAAYHAQIVSDASSYKRLTLSLNVALSAVKQKKPVKQELTGQFQMQVVGRVMAESFVAGRFF